MPDWCHVFALVRSSKCPNSDEMVPRRNESHRQWEKKKQVAVLAAAEVIPVAEMIECLRGCEDRGVVS